VAEVTNEQHERIIAVFERSAARMRIFGLSIDEAGKAFAALGDAIRKMRKEEALRKIRHQPFFTLRTRGKIYPMNPWPKAPND